MEILTNNRFIIFAISFFLQPLLQQQLQNPQQLFQQHKDQPQQAVQPPYQKQQKV